MFFAGFLDTWGVTDAASDWLAKFINFLFGTIHKYGTHVCSLGVHRSIYPDEEPAAVQIPWI